MEKKLNEILQKLQISEKLLEIVHLYYKNKEKNKLNEIENEEVILLNSNISNKLLFLLSEYYTVLNNPEIIGQVEKDLIGIAKWTSREDLLRDMLQKIEQEVKKIKD